MNIPNRGQEPVALEPDVALSMTASGPSRKILPDISSQLMASRVMLSILATNHALVKVMLH